MGYQLWTSPITGYRRRGTRAADLRQAYEAALTTRVLYEPLRWCLATDPVARVRDEMKRLDFDVVGVAYDPAGPVIGYVGRDDLQGDTLDPALRPFGLGDLISESTPVIDLLGVLQARSRAFVLIGSQVKGIVTRADLQKPPVRVLLFGTLNVLEMHLTFWVKQLYLEGEWQQALKAERIEQAQRLLDLRRQRNEGIDLLDRLQFCDKRDLVIAKEEARSSLDLGSEKEAARFLRAIERLRDRLAHAQDDVAGPDGWQEVAGTVQAAERSLVASDRAIEERIRAGNVVEPLFGVTA